MDPEIRNSSSEGIFRYALLKFIRPVASKTYTVNGRMGLKRVRRPQSGFSQLPKPRCHFYNENRTTLMNDLRNIDGSFLPLNDDDLTKLPCLVIIKVRVY